MYALLLGTGHYSVEGVGYATIQDVLLGDLSWFLFVLFALKLVATSLTLGSGASGGIFSPACTWAPPWVGCTGWQCTGCSRDCRSILPPSPSPAWPAWSADPRGRRWRPSS